MEGNINRYLQNTRLKKNTFRLTHERREKNASEDVHTKDQSLIVESAFRT